MGTDQAVNMADQKLNAVPAIQPTMATDELSDTQLERVSAGSRPNCSGPRDMSSDNFSKH